MKVRINFLEKASKNCCLIQTSLHVKGDLATYNAEKRANSLLDAKEVEPDRDRTDDLFHAMKCQSPEQLKTNSL
jgi:hypothetical protein